MRRRKEKTPGEKRRILFFTLLAIAGFLFMIAMEDHFPKFLVFNHTRSLQTGWYLMLPAENLQDGDIVGFELSRQPRELAVSRGWMKEGELTLKRIGALEGGSYEIKENGQFYVNGKYKGQVRETDPGGRRMPHVRPGVYLVPKGSFLPLGDNPASFDGRYYGPEPISEIRFKAALLLPLP